MLVFEKFFVGTKKNECYIPENVESATPKSASSQKDRLLDLSTEFLSPITTEAITYSPVVFSHSLP